jgi:hypothetical protein
VSLHHAHRDEGNGSLRFVDWRIHDQELGDGTVARCNEPCEFRIRYKASDAFTELRNVSVSVTVKDCFGRPLMTGWTRLHEADFDLLPRYGEFRLRFGRLPLSPGTYRVHLWASVQRDVADQVSNAGAFEILPMDVFKTGQQLKREIHGEFVLTEQTWSVVGVDESPLERQLARRPELE